MDRKTIEYMLINSALMDSETTKDLIASQGLGIIKTLEAEAIMQEINKIYADTKSCTYETLTSQLIKNDKTFLIIELSKYMVISSIEYYKYKNDLIEINTKNKIRPKLEEIIRNIDNLTSDELITQLDFRTYRGNKDLNSLVIDLHSEGMKQLEKIEKRIKSIDNWDIQTGYRYIDSRIGEINGGELVVLSAEPSSGKSVLALDLAIYNAKRNKNCIFISQEMSEPVITRRALCNNAYTAQNLFKKYNPTSEDWKILLEVVNRSESLKNLKIIKNMSSCSYADVYTVVQAVTKSNNWEKVDLIVIDYLQYMTGTRDDQTEYEVIKENIKKLAEMSKELDCVVLVISSLNQQGKLEGAATIKFAADHVWFLSRENKEEPKVKFKIEKNRNGETFDTYLRLDGAKSKFYEIQNS